MSSTPSQRKSRTPRGLTVRQLTDRLGGRHSSTVFRTIQRLGLEPCDTSNLGHPLYSAKDIPLIRKSTGICVPKDHLTAARIARLVDRDTSTIWRILKKVLKLAPDYQLPSGACYWHKRHIPKIKEKFGPRRSVA